MGTEVKFQVHINLKRKHVGKGFKKVGFNTVRKSKEGANK